MKHYYGIVEPSENIKKLIKNIADDNNENIKDYLKYFGKLLHKRIGTELTMSERNKLNIGKLPMLKSGMVIAYQERYELFKWGLYIGSADNNKIKILTREGDIINEKDIFKFSIAEYYGGTIVQPDLDKRIDIYEI